MESDYLHASAFDTLHRKDVDSFQMAAVAQKTNFQEVYTLYKPLIENQLIRCDIPFNSFDLYQIALKMYQILTREVDYGN